MSDELSFNEEIKAIAHLVAWERGRWGDLHVIGGDGEARLLGRGFSGPSEPVVFSENRGKAPFYVCGAHESIGVASDFADQQGWWAPLTEVMKAREELAMKLMREASMAQALHVADEDCGISKLPTDRVMLEYFMKYGAS